MPIVIKTSANVNASSFLGSKVLQKLGKILNVQPYKFYYFEPVNEQEMEEQIVGAIKSNKKFLKMVYNLYCSLKYDL